MHGYRDHCIRTTYPAPPFYCPYSMSQLICPYLESRQKVEEYPAKHQERPKNPPPDYTPMMPTSTGSIESSAIFPCTFRYTYLWLKNGESFWSYIAYVGKRAISGWKYKKGRWVQFGLHLRQIKNFTCS